MAEPLNILVIEDRIADFMMVERHFRQKGLPVRCSRVDSIEELKAAIERDNWDLALADYNVPHLDFLEGLNLMRTALPDLPVIMLTGTVGEENAIELLKLGARDFVLKDNLARLVPSVMRALKENGEIIERRRSEERLIESEERYRTLLESVTDYVYTTLVENGRPVTTSHGSGCFAVTGYTSEEYAAEPGLWLGMVHKEDRPIVVEQANSVLAGKPTFTIEHRITRKDGRCCWIRNTPVLRHNQEGSLIAYDGIVTDITEYKKLEEQYRQAQKMEAIGQLAGGVAHDFNNILTAISGYSHLILDHVKGNDPILSYAEEIIDATKRAAVLTQSLLTFSRNQTINLAAIDLSQIIRDNEAFLRRLIREDIELKITCSDEPLTVLVDRGQIEQVIMNLVANARDAMPKGGKLYVESLPVDFDQAFIENHGFGKAGTYAMFSVSDSGIGMDAETQSHIFEPFFTTKDQGKGTGLGLSMAYGVVKKHDGFINVYSEPGKGSTFKIYLPRVRTKAQAGETESRKVVAQHGGSETILVGEDDAALRRLSTNVLGHFGYRVIDAVDGQDAVCKFAEYMDSIHLVILDAIMPKKNGRVAYQEMRALCPELKALFVSGYTKEIFTEGDALDGNAEFIQKPVTPNELLAKVREMLDKK